MDVLEIVQSYLSEGRTDTTDVPVVNLSNPANHGSWKLVIISDPATVGVDFPVKSVTYNEIKLPPKGKSKFSLWRRSPREVPSDLDGESKDLIKSVNKFYYDLRKMKEREFHQYFPKTSFKLKHEVIRTKTYSVFYAYVVEAKTPTGASIPDVAGKVVCFVSPTPKVDSAIRGAMKFLSDTYEASKLPEIYTSLINAGVTGRKNYFDMNFKRDKNYDVTINPVISQPGMKSSIPDVLMSEESYNSLPDPLVTFMGRRGFYKSHLNEVLEFMAKSISGDDSDDDEEPDTFIEDDGAHF